MAQHLGWVLLACWAPRLNLNHPIRPTSLGPPRPPFLSMVTLSLGIPCPFFLPIPACRHWEWAGLPPPGNQGAPLGDLISLSC